MGREEEPHLTSWQLTLSAFGSLLGQKHGKVIHYFWKISLDSLKILSLNTMFILTLAPHLKNQQSNKIFRWLVPTEIYKEFQKTLEHGQFY